MLRVLSLLVILSVLLVLPAYAAPNVKLFNYASYTDPNGIPVIVGEVVNDGNEPIKSVEVKANFIDSDGKVIDSGSAKAAVDVIPSGQRAPFMIIGTADYASTVKSFELQVVNFANAPAKPAKLEIINTDQDSDGITEVSITGEVKNIGDKTATFARVYATFYDERNKVVGLAASTVTETVAPEATTSFEIKYHERVSLITSYTLYAESEQFSAISYGLQSIGNGIDVKSDVNVSRLSLVDQQGNGLGKIGPNERAWIKSYLTNKLPAEQKFTYIVQIKNNEGLPVEIKWIEGTLEPNTSVSQSISWTPEEEGIYFAEVFVWRSIDNPVPLTTSIKTIILLVST
jgi:hypothetical protein